MITLAQSSGGSAGDLAAFEWMPGPRPRWRRVTAAENPSRSTASAPPAGVLCASAQAHDQRIEPPHLGVQQAHGVVLAGSSERNELEHTSSASPGSCGRRCRAAAASRAAPPARLGRRLPRRLAAREAAADNVNGSLDPGLMAAKLGPCPGAGNGSVPAIDRSIRYARPAEALLPLRDHLCCTHCPVSCRRAR